MYQYQHDFIKFCIEHGVLKFGDFTLKSGRESPYFFNSGLFNTGKTLSYLGRFYADAAIDSGIDFNLLFGPAYKGIPLVCTLGIALAEHHNRDIPYAFNRKERKSNGDSGILIGAALHGHKVLIVDDVITAGTSVRESVDIIENAGAFVAGVLIALDRQERGQGNASAIEEIQRTFNIPIISIITLDHIIKHLEETLAAPEDIEKIRAYRKEYGTKS